jgi:outer membrane autotransporter protein
MQITNKVTKVLIAAVLGSLLTVSPVWAAEQTSNVTVTSSNDAGSPYKSITVNDGSAAIDGSQTPALTVYLTDGAEVSCTATNLFAPKIDSIGISATEQSGDTTTVKGNMNLTVTGKNTTGAVNAYGIKGQNGIIALDNVTANIIADASTTNSNDSNASAKAIGIENSGTTNAKDLNLNLTSTGGSAIDNASAKATGLTNGGSLTAGNVNVQATAIGGTVSSASGIFGVDVLGVDNTGSTFQTGDIALNINAQAGTGLASAGSGEMQSTEVIAIGLNNNETTNSNKVNVGNVSGTIVATGKDALGNLLVGATGIENMAGFLTAKGTDLTVIANGAHSDGLGGTATSASAIENNGTNITITGKTKFNVTANNGSSTMAMTQLVAAGVREDSRVKGASITLGDVEGQVKTTLSSVSGSGFEGMAAGIWLAGSGTGQSITANNVDLAVTASSTGVTSEQTFMVAYGLYANSGKIQVNGDATIKANVNDTNNGGNEGGAANALVASDDGGIVNVGTDGTNSLSKTVQLEGDVAAYKNGIINLTLEGSNSYLMGNVFTEGHFDPSSTKVQGTVNMTVTKGATWKPVYDNRFGSVNKLVGVPNSGIMPSVQPQDYTFTDNSIGTLTLSDGGIVDLTWDKRERSDSFRTLTIDSLAGEGGIFKVNSDLANSKADVITLGADSTSTSVGIDVAYDPYLAQSGLLAGSNITGKALVLVDGSKKMTAVTGVADSYNSYDYIPTITDNGDNTFSITKLAITNVISKKVTSPSKPMRNALQDRMALHNLWVNGELNNLQKRMGDLRAATPAESGIWARYEHNKLEKGSYDSLNYNLFQLGFDKDFAGKTGTFYRGAAFSYGKGTGDYENANGDLKYGALSLYQTWMGKDGRYYDVILKGGKLMNNYDLTNTANPASADYHNWAYSISGEVGKRFTKANGFFVEPQLEMELGRINGTNYTTSTGLDIDIASQSTAVARLGVSAGREVKNGSYYAKASYFHDFGGGLNITAADSNIDPYVYGERSAKNWCIFTLGGQVKASKNCNVYGELSKYTGELSNNLQVNIGARWSF